MGKKSLEPKQKLFCEEYVKDMNGTQAAIRAGYSERTANEQAARLLAKASVQEYLNKLIKERSERTKIDSDRVLTEIAKLAFTDIRKIFNENGQLLPVHMLPDEVAASVSSVEVVTTKIPGTDPVEVEHTAKIKFWDKRGSLELLGKHLKLFTEKVEHTGKDGGPIEISDSEAAAKLAAIMNAAKARKESSGES